MTDPNCLPTTVEIAIRRKPGNEDLPLPSRRSAGASGYDLHAALREPVFVRRGEVVLVPTGLELAIPPGYEAQVRPRSGLALEHGIFLVNSPGTIDSDYRGEVGVLVSTVKDRPFRIERGMRIAQLVFAPVTAVRFLESEELSSTRRGAGGFGHTGTAAGAST